MNSAPRDAHSDADSTNWEEDLTLLYADLDLQIAQAGPICNASGNCCRFKEYGHTLFLSQMEAEYLVETPPPPSASRGPDRCPYQVANLCNARDRRPLGCRVYFCDPTFTNDQQDLSEEYIKRLKELHEVWGRSWSYRPLHHHLDDLLSEAFPEPPRLVVLGDLP